MKKISSLCLCFMLFFSASQAFCKDSVDTLAPRAPEARMWDSFDIAFKSLSIGGLLVGYREGIAVGAASEHRRLKNDTVLSRTEADQLISRAEVLFNNPVSFYVEQADNFMQTYPVCKKMQLTQWLAQLVSVWAALPLNKQMGYDFTPLKKYKHIAEACREVYSK